MPTAGVTSATTGPATPHLRDFSELTVHQTLHLQVDQLTAAVATISSTTGWPQGTEPPDLTAVSAAIDAMGRRRQPPPSRRPGTTNPPTAPAESGLTTAVRAVHDSLLVSLSSVPNLGSAYRVGVGLANTCARHQSLADVERNFNPYRLGYLHTWLTDLVSVLPEHAGRPVAESLTQWRDALYRADPALSAGLQPKAPAAGSPPATGADRVATLQPYIARLNRQGELWLSVLTGAKNPADLLEPEDYVSATARAIRAGSRLLLRSPALVVVPFLVMAAALAAILSLLATAHGANPEARITVQVVAVAGAVGGWLKSVANRMKSVVRVLEQPLYDAALDAVIAEAITLPPVGPDDPTGWVQYLESASLVLVEASQPEGLSALVPGT